jgi:hypothetical protein
LGISMIALTISGDFSPIGTFAIDIIKIPSFF